MRMNLDNRPVKATYREAKRIRPGRDRLFQVTACGPRLEFTGYWLIWRFTCAAIPNRLAAAHGGLGGATGAKLRSQRRGSQLRWPLAVTVLCLASVFLQACAYVVSRGPDIDGGPAPRSRITAPGKPIPSPDQDMAVSRPAARKGDRQKVAVAAPVQQPAQPQPADQIVPAPRASRPAPDSATHRAITSLVAFNTAPFPYTGTIPGSERPFLDINENGRRGHRAGRGRIYWEDQTYSEKRVLLHIPERFDIRRPAVMVVYFHGHGAKLEDDIRDRQQLPEQISRSNANAVLVAPQFATDAADSSPGKFWKPGAFARFLDEAARQLATMQGDPQSVRTFARMPIILVGYSGGYVPTAWALSTGGATSRVRGVVLLDALYGELDKFEDWITTTNSGFFISAYLNSTRARNLEFQHRLAERNVPLARSLEDRLRPRSVTFIAGGPDEHHRDFVTQAWTTFPVKDVLSRLPEYSRRSPVYSVSQATASQ